MRIVLGSALVSVVALGLAGCGSAAEDPGAVVASPSVLSTPLVTPTPESTPESTPTPTPSPTAPDPAVAALTARLLTDIPEPGTPDDEPWTIKRTGPAPATPFGACARETLAELGATRVLERVFLPPAENYLGAVQQVAQFPAGADAAQAWAALASWRDRCATTTVDGSRPKAFELTPLTVTGGAEARWYRVDWGTDGSEAAHPYEYVGMARRGGLVAVLILSGRTRALDFMPGTDGTYPIERPLARAAARLG